MHSTAPIKTCSVCGVARPETKEFYYFRKDSGRFREDCKDCFKRAKHERYWRDPEKARAIARKSYHRPEGEGSKGALTKTRNRRARPEVYDGIAERYERYHRAERHAARVARHAANREADNAAATAWYYANRERAIASARAVIARNPERSRRFAHATRAKRRGALGSFTVEEWEAKQRAYEGCCAYCGAPATELEHVLPLARGGTNSIDNLVPACFECNRSKHDKTIEEWLGAEGGRAMRTWVERH